MRSPWIWSSTWKIPTKSPNSFLQIQNVSTNFGVKIVKWCKLAHVSPPKTTTSEVQARNCFNCIQMLLGRYKTPVSHLLAGQSFFVTSLKTVLIRFHVNEKAAMFVLRFGIEEKQQREQAAARRDGNSSGIREAGKPLLTSTLLPQPPKPLPSPVLELTTKLLSCFGSEIKLTCYPSSFTWWRISL